MHGTLGRLHAAHAFPPLLVFVSSLVTVVHAQQPAPASPPRVEVWGTIAGDTGTLDGETVSDYSPRLLSGTAIASRASQILAVDPSASLGFEAGVNVFFTRWFGVQGLVGVTRADVSGRNGSYDVLLRYETRQPPDYVPREFEVRSSTAWPDTAGSLKTTWWAVGAVARWRTPAGDAGGTVAGGVGFERYAGDIESLGYTIYRMGGHAVLFPSEHRVVVSPSAAGTLARPYVSADVHRCVGSRVAIMTGWRVHLDSRRDLPLGVERLVDPADSPIVPDLADVERDLGQPPLVLSGMRWQVVAGLKLFF